jgi:hypothetical protein
MKNDSLYYLAAAVLIVGWALTPGKTHAAKNRNVSLNFEGNAEHCSDLKVTSNGEIAQATETYTLQKSEAPILEMVGMDKAVLRVRGSDRADYSVEVCKIAVADDRASAEQAVRSISVSRSAGRISSTGPSNDDANWQVYFIVRAPKDANLNLETKNGPIDVAGINGTLKVRATNGPVAVHDCAGMVDVHTANGPISFNGGGGEVHLTAQNGPISLNLAGEIWNGSQLDARTFNGPVSLVFPETFRSGVRLETSGRSPISCAAGACRSAWTSGMNQNGSDQRVIQLNGSQDTIRVSTNNGPVSVNGPSRGRRIM